VVLFYPWLPARVAGHGSATLLAALLPGLAAKAEVHLVCGRLAHEKSMEPSVQALVASARVVELPHVASLRGVARAKEALATGLKMSCRGLPLFAAKQWRRALVSALQDTLQRVRPDVLHLEIGAVAPYAALSKALPTVLVDHEVLDTPESRAFIQKHYARIDVLQTLCTHDAEVLSALLEREVGVRAVALADAAIVQRAPVPGRMLFVGSPRHAPNRSALAFLCEQVLPAMASRSPTVKPQLRVVGASAEEFGMPPQAAVEFAGRVNDVEAELARAAVFLAPVSEGGGVRIKNCEALRAGVPLVTTPLGMHGLEEFAGQGVRVAPLRNFADAVLEVLGHPARAEAQAQTMAQLWRTTRTCARSVDETVAMWEQALSTRRR